jgi:tRNA dimethylallyltransferase
MIVILGPTASGKTTLAANVAFELDGEIISADSRQVYKGMDVGTGKDLGEYTIRGKKIPYHLIDIAEPGYEYNLFEFRQGFLKASVEIMERGKLPVLCGGSGLYMESVLRGFQLIPVNKDPEFEKSLRSRTDDELIKMLQGLRPLHNTTDILDRERLIRAIEIATPHPPAPSPEGEGEPKPPHPPAPSPEGEGEKTLKTVIFGIWFEREVLRKRITERLERRLQNGLVEEVERLLNHGLTPDQLKFYGLEYRYITLFLQKEIDFMEMFRLLNTAIHQYSKRQMTWFRKMERSGFTIHWIDGTLEMEYKIKELKRILRQVENVS